MQQVIKNRLLLGEETTRQQAICCGKNLNFLLLNIDSTKACVAAGGFHHLKSATIHRNICSMFLKKTVLGTDKEMFHFLTSESKFLQQR